MRVLITGAGGFIGSHLVLDQLRRGHEVTAVDLNVCWLEKLSAEPNLTVLAKDFADVTFLESHLPGHDVCFHLASAHLETAVDESHFWKVNVQDTRCLVECCHQAGISRFVHCSSVGVYGDIKNPPADEESACHPDVVYEKSKLAGETAILDYVSESGYEVTIVRPAWVYGPRCPRTLRLFRAIKKRRFFFVGNGHTLRHPIYISDMTRGFDVVATHHGIPGEVFIMAGPCAVTIEELARTIAQCLGVPTPTLRFPKPLVWSGAFLLELVGKVLGKDLPVSRRSLKFFTGNTAFRTKKAERVLGFQPQVELWDGIQRTYQWLLETEQI